MKIIVILVCIWLFLMYSAASLAIGLWFADDIKRRIVLPDKVDVFVFTVAWPGLVMAMLVICFFKRQLQSIDGAE